MPFQIVKNDITKMKVDAIVNAANSTLLGGGGVDGAIHNAAGPDLLEECRRLKGCNQGFAKITRGYRLPAKYVIHTVGPIWNGGNDNEKQILESCYRECLELASAKRLKSIAFPLISAGAYGYPEDEALKVASDTIEKWLESNEIDVYLVIFDKSELKLSKATRSEIDEYISRNYVDKVRRYYDRDIYSGNVSSLRRSEDIDEGTADPVSHKTQDGHLNYSRCYSQKAFSEVPRPMSDGGSGLPKSVKVKTKTPTGEVPVFQLDISFMDALFELIDRSGMTDVECYKKANIDRKHFSKMKSTKNYKPKKKTAIAFAVALKLSIEDTNKLLEKAGYVLSKSSMFDVIVSYYLEKKIYNVNEINIALAAYDQELLGC